VSFKSQEPVESFALHFDQLRAFVSVQGTARYELTLPETVNEVVTSGISDSRFEVPTVE
jgi:hypothetical protein